jgi:uncharacterized protein
MLKVIIIGVAVALLLWLLFGRASRGGQSRPRGNGGARDSTEEMVTCAHCGVHLPRSESVAARGLHYCGVAHRDLPPPAA